VAAEKDAVGEQQLKRTQSGSSKLKRTRSGSSKLKQMQSRNSSWSGCSWGAAAEADAIGVQFLVW